MERRLPVGAEVIEAGGVHFRVWAPVRERVDVLIGDQATALASQANGYFAGMVPDAGHGTRYRFRLDGRDSFPDPASRSQPDGPHGASQVIDPSRYPWTDSHWPGLAERGQIIYEMHIGTFTPEGTYLAAADQLQELAALGVSAIELMPLAEFPGEFGWGYDGVDLFAPYHGYGTPDELREFVNRAHAHGLGVIIDVVYNHFGPDGNYLREYSGAYFSERHVTEWGDGVNFDGPDSVPVREFVLSNVRHWVDEYHMDGLRLDATHSIHDASPKHIFTEIGEAARQAGRSAGRGVLVVAENEPQDARLVRDTASGGHGLTQIWTDDFHHTAHVACTGRREAYFMDYRGSAQEFVSALKHGILYQGQYYTWQKHRRGHPALDIQPHQCVFYLENHDQVANSRDGKRLHELTSAAKYRALSALLLLAPQTPLIFQGQEFGASSPFLYFADHQPALNKLVRRGRAEFMKQFASVRDAAANGELADPGSAETFRRSRLDLAERSSHAEHYALYRDLIALRRCDPVLSGGGARVDGAVLSDHAFVLRFLTGSREDRLLVVNLGGDLPLDVAPEPLLAAPLPEVGWQRLWHSEERCYGGAGASALEAPNGSWRIPAESATLLAADG